MPRLAACPHCQQHVLTTESRCPHCDGSLRSRGGTLALTAAAVLMGFTPIACDKDGPDTSPPADSGGLAEPEYGAPMTDPVDDEDPGQDSGDQDPGMEPEPDPGFEPEYGVPISDDVAAPMYGVPESEIES